MVGKMILGAAAALTFVAAITTTTPAFAGASFPAVVEKVLMSQTDGPVSKLPADKKRELISCVNQVLAELPNGRKKFVAAAASYDEMEDRFGIVVMENRAEWKQRIARGCAHIVV
jgi:hypothetical protein